jgi:phosphonoacetate hydrolase
MSEHQIKATTFEVNGITYDLPAAPIVVICLDGSADAYLDAALARDAMPNLKKISVKDTEVKREEHFPRSQM